MSLPGPDHSTPLLLCAGCHAPLVEQPVPEVCPRCGTAVPIKSDAATTRTLLMSERPAAGTERPARTEAGNGSVPGPLVGQRLHVYEIQSLLGAGAMGRVYRARHVDLDRLCALKVLSPKAAERDVDYVARFSHEGRAAAALVHPNVVTVHAIGESGPYHFLEMEFVPGPSLQQVIQAEGRLTPLRATALLAQIADGLAAAHRAGIVHRDLKPDNVMLTPRGLPKIADFGLAKRVVWKDGLPADHLAGTPNFMAPELFQGTAASPASDVYALGITYYLLLTGRFPFVWTTLGELMHAACHEPLPPVRRLCPDIPLEMAECVELLTARCPDNRPRDGIEAGQLLHAIAGEVRDLDSLLREAFTDNPAVTWTRTGERFRLHVAFPNGRRQALFLEPSDHAADERLLLIYSLCCPAQPDHYEYVLRLNAEVAHGGLAIRDIDGRSYFCMVDTYPRPTVDAEEIRRSVLEIASRADHVEHLLTGLDHQ